jgi:hypothetical protein
MGLYVDAWFSIPEYVPFTSTCYRHISSCFLQQKTTFPIPYLLNFGSLQNPNLGQLPCCSITVLITLFSVNLLCSMLKSPTSALKLTAMYYTVDHTVRAHLTGLNVALAMFYH